MESHHELLFGKVLKINIKHFLFQVDHFVISASDDRYWDLML